MAVHKRKVLLVGIDAQEAPFLVDRLRRHGHPILLADNGATGLLEIHRERPVLVVAAARMPIMNGFQLLQVLRQDREIGHTPVILVTEGDGVEEMARAGLAGADLCLSRHSSAADMTLCIERALRLAAACDPSVLPAEESANGARSTGRAAAAHVDERWEDLPDEAWAGTGTR
jgi:DNA-binding response OmpR family regulator